MNLDSLLSNTQPSLCTNRAILACVALSMTLLQACCETLLLSNC
jgi:hypothetical protein